MSATNKDLHEVKQLAVSSTGTDIRADGSTEALIFASRSNFLGHSSKDDSSRNDQRVARGRL